MKTKVKKAIAPQLDLEPAIEGPKAEVKSETKSYRRTEALSGRRNLFRDLREGETAT